MEAIKKIATVKNHKLTVDLPEHFNHHRVEVIILPCAPPADAPEETVPAWQRDFLSVSCWGEPEEVESLPSWPLQTF